MEKSSKFAELYRDMTEKILTEGREIANYDGDCIPLRIAEILAGMTHLDGPGMMHLSDYVMILENFCANTDAPRVFPDDCYVEYDPLLYDE